MYEHECSCSQNNQSSIRNPTLLSPVTLNMLKLYTGDFLIFPGDLFQDMYMYRSLKFALDDHTYIIMIKAWG